MWALGFLFVASGTFALSIPLCAPEWRTWSFWERAAILAIGLGHLGGGLFSTIGPKATRTELDRASRTGWQQVRRLWPSRSIATERFQLADAREVEIVRSTDNDGDPQFRLRLWLVGSRAVWLQAQPSLGEDNAREHAERLRRFLRFAPQKAGE
jgi:hypothetical protein